MISTELAAFIETGVSILAGTRDATLAPDCLRCVGVQVEPDPNSLTVFLPVATAATSVRNLIDNGRIAVCFARIIDHKTYLFKGRATRIRLAEDACRARVDRYRRAIAQELAAVGLPQHITFRVNHWPCYAVTCQVDSLFDQTPGPGAGERLADAALAGGGLRLEVDEPPPTAWRQVALKKLDKVVFQGVIPSLIATCDLQGEPNVTYLSQVFFLDRQHVALSCQFFNKTKRNLLENPRAAINLYHPLTFEAYRLWLRFDHAETSGSLFDTMAARIQVIASHTGMKGIFRLLSADVHEVKAVAPIEGYLVPLAPEDPHSLAVPDVEVSGSYHLTELRGLQVVSARIAGAADLESMLDASLAALDELFGFRHTMVLVLDEALQRLAVLAARGYAGGFGAEVALGNGVIGMAAEQRRMVRLSGMGSNLTYGRAVRGRLEARGEGCGLAPEIELPGLADAQAQLALPLLVGERLIGVLALESRDALSFDEWDETFLQIIANQIAMGIHHLEEEADDEAAAEPPAGGAEPAVAPPCAHVRRLMYYKNDDCVFVDGEYLIRNVPARILWRVLERREHTGQHEFTNRELRLDDSLGLPAYRDNLESRLILLRKRLELKCPEIRLVPVRRGRFALELDCAFERQER